MKSMTAKATASGIDSRMTRADGAVTTSSYPASFIAAEGLHRSGRVGVAFHEREQTLDCEESVIGFFFARIVDIAQAVLGAERLIG